MLTAAIQIEYTVVYFNQSKTENPILSFLIWNFAIESISFSKEKEFNNAFDGWHSNVWFFYYYYLHERSPKRKKQRQAKMCYNGKNFCYKPSLLF